MGMSKTVSNLLTLSSVRNTFIAVNNEWFQAYVTVALGSVCDYSVGQILDLGHIERLGVLAE